MTFRLLVLVTDSLRRRSNVDYIIRVYRYTSKCKDHAYPVADIRMSDNLRISDERFARKHGGDYIEFLSIDDEEYNDCIYTH